MPKKNSPRIIGKTTVDESKITLGQFRLTRLAKRDNDCGHVP
ncbi:MAG: hypothetical protein QF927_05725 [Verrucomicrobiota bacterium]|nr:hypothetical protein [Verrucomicrobiota bacterium]